jgi:DNA modification methylase
MTVKLDSVDTKTPQRKRFESGRRTDDPPDRGNNSLLAEPANERKVEWVSIASLQPHPSNARTHSPRQIRQIARSIREFGWTVPILADRNGGVIAGHARLEAARTLDIDRVPIIRLEHLTEAQVRAYVIADNKLAENAGWDQQILAQELQFLSKLDLNFDLTLTGFETAEIDLMIQGSDPMAGDSADDEILQLDESNPVVSRHGDLWIASEHHLLCGDATKRNSFKLLLGRRKAQLIFTDPPWNLKIDGNVSGLGAIKHREFPMASGEMSDVEFINFLKTIASYLVAFSSDGSIHFICMDYRHLFELLLATRGLYSELKNLCVWNKDNGGMGSFYRSKHELILVYKNGTAPHINNIELGRFGRNRTNVWNYPGANSLRDGRREELAMHPTVKPVAMVADAILDCSKRGGLVLDSFGGSGTTLIAAEKTGRRAALMELDPAYVDLTIRRYQKLTGEKMTLAATGLTFDEVEAEREANTATRTEGTESTGG